MSSMSTCGRSRSPRWRASASPMDRPSPLGRARPAAAALRHHRGRCPEVVTAKVRLTLHTVGIDPEEGAPDVCQLLGLPVGRERLADLARRGANPAPSRLRHLYLGSSRPTPSCWPSRTCTGSTHLGSLPGVADRAISPAHASSCHSLPAGVSPALDPQVLRHPVSPLRSRQRTAGGCSGSGPADGHDLRHPGAADPRQGARRSLLPGGDRSDIGGPGHARHESGMALPPDIQLPATVQDVLGARIDRLPADEKALLRRWR